MLALSATPIPRTLQMSLAGLRDISVIETPPEGRRPVHTYVGDYDEDLVKAAIERELARGGQVFYLHDRVETIDEAAERVRALCPQAKRHGRARADGLGASSRRRCWTSCRGKTNVLVSTTIIESGLDIPQANTLIVERADRLGLAQLYQIRGRVGRSRERAYAYLLYPSAEALTGDAAARLATLSDYTELGSGFKIAMRDLEIRGAGEPARRRAVRSRRGGRLRAVLPDARRSGSQFAVGRSRDEDPEWEPVRLDVLGRCVRPGAVHPLRGREDRRAPAHRRRARARRPRARSSRSSTTASARCPSRSPTSCALQEARIKLGRAGARTVEFRQGRLTVSPIELDSGQARALREEVEGAVYESLKRTLRFRVPDEAEDRFAAVVRVADALLRAKEQQLPAAA